MSHPIERSKSFPLAVSPKPRDYFWSFAYAREEVRGITWRPLPQLQWSGRSSSGARNKTFGEKTINFGSNLFRHGTSTHFPLALLIYGRSKVVSWLIRRHFTQPDPLTSNSLSHKESCQDRGWWPLETHGWRVHDMQPWDAWLLINRQKIVLLQHRQCKRSGLQRARISELAASSRPEGNDTFPGEDPFWRTALIWRRD